MTEGVNLRFLVGSLGEAAGEEEVEEVFEEVADVFAAVVVRLTVFVGVEPAEAVAAGAALKKVKEKMRNFGVERKRVEKVTNAGAGDAAAAVSRFVGEELRPEVLSLSVDAVNEVSEEDCGASLAATTESEDRDCFGASEGVADGVPVGCVAGVFECAVRFCKRFSAASRSCFCRIASSCN